MTSHLEQFIEEENNRDDFVNQEEEEDHNRDQKLMQTNQTILQNSQNNPRVKHQIKPRLQRKQSQDIRRIMPRCAPADLRNQSLQAYFRQVPPCNNETFVLLQQANTQRNLLRRDLGDIYLKLQHLESYMNMLQQPRIEKPKPKCRACKNQNAQPNRKYCNSCASKRKKCSSLDCDMKCGFDYDYCFHCSAAKKS